MLTLVFWIIAGNVTVLALMLAHWYRTEFKHHVDAESLPTRPELLLKSIESNHPIYYFGVGSNMLRSKVEGRSYDGSRIEIISFEPGFAPGYRLAFNSRTFPPLEPAMASIEPILPQDSSCWTQCGALHPNADNSCHGALVQSNPDQYAKLWRSEGGGTNAQTYEEIVVTVYPYYNVDDSNSNNKKEPVLSTGYSIESSAAQSITTRHVSIGTIHDLVMSRGSRTWIARTLSTVATRPSSATRTVLDGSQTFTLQSSCLYDEPNYTQTTIHHEIFTLAIECRICTVHTTTAPTIVIEYCHSLHFDPRFPCGICCSELYASCWYTASPHSQTVGTA